MKLWGKISSDPRNIYEFGVSATQVNVYIRRFLFIFIIRYWKHCYPITRNTKKLFSVSPYSLTMPTLLCRLNRITEQKRTALKVMFGALSYVWPRQCSIFISNCRRKSVTLVKIFCPGQWWGQILKILRMFPWKQYRMHIDSWSECETSGVESTINQ